MLWLSKTFLFNKALNHLSRDLNVPIFSSLSMHVAKWIYWWSPNKQSLTTACTHREKAQWVGFWVKLGGYNLNNQEGVELEAGLEPESLNTDKAGRDTPALSALANEELQNVLGFCSGMIHTVKVIKRGLWEAFGCYKLLSPKHHSGMAQRLQGRATSQQAAHRWPPWFGSCRISPSWAWASLCQLVPVLPNIQFAQADVLSECSS